jgi:hypothetical protein
MLGWSFDGGVKLRRRVSLMLRWSLGRGLAFGNWSLGNGSTLEEVVPQGSFKIGYKLAHGLSFGDAEGSGGGVSDGLKFGDVAGVGFVRLEIEI